MSFKLRSKGGPSDVIRDDLITVKYNEHCGLLGPLTGALRAEFGNARF